MGAATPRTLYLEIAEYVRYQYFEEKIKMRHNCSGVLTQLGGWQIVEEGKSGVKYEWKDEGICHVANFEDILSTL